MEWVEEQCCEYEAILAIQTRRLIPRTVNGTLWIRLAFIMWFEPGPASRVAVSILKRSLRKAIRFCAPSESPDWVVDVQTSVTSAVASIVQHILNQTNAI